MTQQYTTTKEVVELARSGDRQATEELMQAFLSVARPLAWSYAQSSQLEFDDLMQEIALRMYRYWSKILASHETNPFPYAKTVAQNCLITLYQKQARRRRIMAMVPLMEGWC